MPNRGTLIAIPRGRTLSRDKKNDLLYLVIVTAIAFVCSLVCKSPHYVEERNPLPQTRLLEALPLWNPNTLDKTLSAVPAAPSFKHLLGSDSIGRDVLSRTLFAVPRDLIFSLFAISLATAAAFLLGTLPQFLSLSLFSNLFSPKTHRVIQTFQWICVTLTPAFRALPFFFLAAAFSEARLTTPLWSLFLWALFAWPGLSLKLTQHTRNWSQDTYVSAAMSSGTSPWRMFWRHFLPYLLPRYFTLLPKLTLECIAVLAALRYLGLGSLTSSPTLGEFLQQFTETPSAWWLLLPPVFSLAGIWCVLHSIDIFIQRLVDPRIRLTLRNRLGFRSSVS